MTGGDLLIGDARIGPGARAEVDLPVARLASHAPVTLTVLVRRGAAPGPTLFVSAAVHGDEVVGTEVIRRLLRHPALADLSGTLLAVPVVNAYGFAAGERCLPDRRDLNRSFPGARRGSLAAQLARLFFREVVRRSDLGIDLHTGGRHRANLPHLRLAADDAAARGLAAAFGAPAVLRGAAPEGSLRAAAGGLPVLVYEGGEALRMDEEAVRAGLAGCLGVLRAAGMIPDGPLPRPPAWLDRGGWERAPEGGVVRHLASLGDAAREGDVLAVVGDPFGRGEEPVRARRDGVVIGRSHLPTANRGDALYNLAVPGGGADPAAAIAAARAAWSDPGLAGGDR